MLFLVMFLVAAAMVLFYADWGTLNGLKRVGVIGFLVLLSFLIAPASNAQARGGRLLFLPVRVVAKGVKATAIVATAPARGIRQVQLNSLERRRDRGNRLAAARLEGAASRARARSCN